MNLNVPFNNHGLTTEEIEVLKKGNFQTIEDLLLTPSQDIAKRCKISPLDIGRIKDTVFQAVPLPLQRLDTLDVNEDEQFTTGDGILDSVLGGGVRTGMIWEVVGESSAGKTQLALQLSLFVQVPRTLRGLSGSTCYLTTSSKLPTARLLQILECDQTLSSFSSLEHVHTINIPTVATLQYITANTLPSFIEQQRSNPNAKPVRLVVIDALGELFHSESRTTTSTLVERSKNLTTLSATLRELAYTHKIAIVVLNEVIDRFDRPVQEHGDQTDLLYENQSRWFNTAAYFGESQKEASLGLTWATHVNTRIMLTRTGRRRYLGDQDVPKRRRLEPSPKEDGQQAIKQPAQDLQPTLIRRLAIIFSNVTSPVSLDYIVTERGIIALPGEKTEQVVNQDISGQIAQHHPGLTSTAGLLADPLVSSNPVPEQELADEQLWATEDTWEDLDWDALEHTLSQVVPQ